MVSNAQIGELIVGAYHKVVTDAEVVSYNSRSKEDGEQMEIDVVAIDSSDGTQTVYACEVVTHLNGKLYSGTPDTDNWSSFGNESYQYSLEKLETKFRSDHGYVTRVFDDADEYVFQLWAPYVVDGILTDGLEVLSSEFQAEHGESIEFVINETYTECVNELRTLAADETKAYGEPAFRFLQITEQLR
ncbi:hypothetical protein [Natronorubrum daqingense]|uniref:Restriction endonuclease n=1 Tax=Natronorubrum daqingense TaxID=588898 RepID=A0A1N7E6C0_9EURY|nr:hypothetical protein [Natronorubrum daqingense]APX96387.1 hypothetical protein BB347_07015 [Natronorubrum daqingense]SIR83627.1 hypothetical protein SAMN05421809_2489 [Natronorubrum daqingense]